MLGGIEASLRRITHYDFWSNKLRRPLLFDAKADFLLYGMSEKSVVEFANALKDGKGVESVRGLCYIAKEPRDGYLNLPSFTTCTKDDLKFMDAFDIFYANNDPYTANGLNQEVDGRFLVQNPPPFYLTQAELDEVYALPFMRDLHPRDRAFGEVKALETIKFSINTHQGCYGECNFCAITVHQGRAIRSRSEKSIVDEAKIFTSDKKFKGIIHDVGGASANMYGFECDKKFTVGSCSHKSCIFPTTCRVLKPNHSRQINLLKSLRELPKVKKVFVASGIRYDLISEDKKHGKEYLQELVDHHISGQMKVAPEHIDDEILTLMAKPKKESLVEFKKLFDSLNHNKKQFLTYYLIAGHPGCKESHMYSLKEFATKVLKMNPEQAQIFIPTPSTRSEERRVGKEC